MLQKCQSRVVQILLLQFLHRPTSPNHLIFYILCHISYLHNWYRYLVDFKFDTIVDHRKYQPMDNN